MKLNPYMAGNPVGGRDAFVGRSDVIRDVVRVLDNPNQNALVIYGQRRIGKTSVLLELCARLPHEGTYHPVYFDLQDKAALTLEEVLEQLASHLALDFGVPLPKPSGENAAHIFRHEFMPNVLSQLSVDTSLVLIFDEFDVLDNPSEGQAGETFFHYLREFLSTGEQRLKFLFAIGRNPEDLSSLTLSVFKGVKTINISLLSSEDTAEVVRLSEKKETLCWSDAAVSRIRTLTGGHPFLTQQLCQEIWERANEEEPDEPPVVEPDDVDKAINPALRSARNALEWLWDGLNSASRVVASALAEAGQGVITQEDLEGRLLDSGVRILISELQDAPRLLQRWDLIEPANGGYCFRVEMLRLWIAESKPLARVHEELDRIQPVAENLFQAAYGLYKRGDLEQAIPILRQAIGHNPNHQRANLVLAEILLAKGEVTEARQLLESLYEYRPVTAGPRLVQALLLLAQNAKDEEEQLNLFERVLELNPKQPEAEAGSQKIWERRGDEALAADDLDKALAIYKKANMQEKANKVEETIDYNQVEAGLQKIASLEEGEKYQEALDIAKQLHKEYPQYRDSMPNLEIFEKKTHLDSLYQNAMSAILKSDMDNAKSFLVKVISLEPGYHEATRYLHKAVANEDVAELKDQLEKERLLRKQAEDLIRKEVKSRSQLEKGKKDLRDQIEELNNIIKQERGKHQKAEATIVQVGAVRDKVETQNKKLKDNINNLQAQLLAKNNTLQEFRAKWGNHIVLFVIFGFCLLVSIAVIVIENM